MSEKPDVLSPSSSLSGRVHSVSLMPSYIMWEEFGGQPKGHSCRWRSPQFA